MTKEISRRSFLKGGLAAAGGIFITGIFRVFKNLPDVVFSPEFTLFIDISHLGFMMFYLFAALLFLIIKFGWTRKIVDC